MIKISYYTTGKLLKKKREIKKRKKGKYKLYEGKKKGDENRKKKGEIPTKNERKKEKFVFITRVK